MVKFIHTADWQLGKPFAQFDAGLSEQLRQARIDMIEAIGNLATAKGAPHVIVAGDVFDQQLPSPKTIRQSLDVMAAADVNFYLLPGNHDPHRANGLWSRLGDLPPNIIPLLENSPLEIEAGCFLLPAPWFSKNPGKDNTAWMDEAETPKGSIRIGVAHGSIHDFESQTNASQKCVIAAHKRIKQGALDYLALGDWHGQISVGERIHYSGTPETDAFKSNNPGYVISAEIKASGTVPTIETIRTTRFHWFGGDLEILPDMDIEAELQTLLADGIADRYSLGRIALKGRLAAAQSQKVQAFLNQKAPAFAYFSPDYSKLETTYTEDDFDELGLSGSLRETADTLLSRKEDDSYARAERQTAARALELLLTFAGSAGS